MKGLRTIRCRFTARLGDRKEDRHLRRWPGLTLALSLPLLVVVSVGIWAGQAGAGASNAGGAPAWAGGPPPTPPVFSATVHVLPSATDLSVGESFWVRVAISVSEGCQYPIYELTLDQDPPLFAYTSPSTATVGPPVSNPFVYTLTAVKPGRAILNAVAYGERYCGDYWNWRYLAGSSESVAVRGQHQVYLPLVSRACTFDVHTVDVWPEPPGPLDRRAAFPFRASISYTAGCKTSASVVAFRAYLQEVPPGCQENTIPTDRRFWMDYENFGPGESFFRKEFVWRDEPGFDRLVVRVRVLEPWPVDRWLYCVQEEYALTP